MLNPWIGWTYRDCEWVEVTQGYTFVDTLASLQSATGLVSDGLMVLRKGMHPEYGTDLLDSQEVDTQRGKQGRRAVGVQRKILLLLETEPRLTNHILRTLGINLNSLHSALRLLKGRGHVRKHRVERKRGGECSWEITEGGRAVLASQEVASA